MRSASSYILSAAAALTAVVSAQSSTTTIQIFGAGPTQVPLNGVDASVVDANAAATTLALECTDEQLCALKSPVTVTEGPSTYTLSAVFSTQTDGVDAEMTLMQNCHITSSTQGASCSVSLGIEISGDGISTSTNTATATSFASDEIYYRPLTVTAGVDKLNRPQATQTPHGAAAGRMGMGGAGAGAAAAVAAAAAMGMF
ncbi:hypothetical protein VTN96DRAFT_9044 [Rasamsonia emersonii]